MGGAADIKRVNLYCRIGSLEIMNTASGLQRLLYCRIGSLEKMK